MGLSLPRTVFHKQAYAYNFSCYTDGMGYFKSLANAVLNRGRNRGGESGLATSFAYGSSYSGGNTDPERLLRECPTVLTCVQTVARTIAELEIKAGNPAVQALIDQPNSWQTRYEFIHSLVFDLLTHGNAYVRIMRNASGRRLQLLPCDPKDVRPQWANDRVDVEYIFTVAGDKPYFQSGEIIHIRDMPPNDVMSLSRVQMARPRIHALIAADRLIQDTFKYGGSVGYSAEVPEKLSPEEMKLLGEEIVKQFTGEQGTKRNGILVLAGGGKLMKHDGMTPADADLRELREDLIREIAAVFGVPPFIAGGIGDTKYSNVTARLQAMYRDAIAPIVANLEARLSKAMNTRVMFAITDLLTGDLQNQVTSATMAAGGPVLTPNEAREILGKMPMMNADMDTVRMETSTEIADFPHSRDGENQGMESDE